MRRDTDTQSDTKIQVSLGVDALRVVFRVPTESS